MFQAVIWATSLSLAVPAPDDTQAVLKNIQGEWLITKWLSTGGASVPHDEAVFFEDDSLCIRSPEGKLFGKFKIARMSDGQIDLVNQMRPVIGGVHLGIYSLDGDKLKISFAIGGAPRGEKPTKRPENFEAPADSPYEVYFLQRQIKPDEGK